MLLLNKMFIGPKLNWGKADKLVISIKQEIIIVVSLIRGVIENLKSSKKAGVKTIIEHQNKILKPFKNKIWYPKNKIIIIRPPNLGILPTWISWACLFNWLSLKKLTFIKR